MPVMKVRLRKKGKSTKLIARCFGDPSVWKPYALASVGEGDSVPQAVRVLLESLRRRPLVGQS